MEWVLIIVLGLGTILVGELSLFVLVARVIDWLFSE